LTRAISFADDLLIAAKAASVQEVENFTNMEMSIITQWSTHTHTKKRTELVTFFVETAFDNGLLKERYKGDKVTERRGRRYRKLLDDLKERRVYSHLMEETLDRAMWRAPFGRGFGPVVI